MATPRDRKYRDKVNRAKRGTGDAMSPEELERQIKRLKAAVKKGTGTPKQREAAARRLAQLINLRKTRGRKRISDAMKRLPTAGAGKAFREDMKEDAKSKLKKKASAASRKGALGKSGGTSAVAKGKMAKGRSLKGTVEGRRSLKDKSGGKPDIEVKASRGSRSRALVKRGDGKMVAQGTRAMTTTAKRDKAPGQKRLDFPKRKQIDYRAKEKLEGMEGKIGRRKARMAKADKLRAAKKFKGKMKGVALGVAGLAAMGEATRRYLKGDKKEEAPKTEKKTGKSDIFDRVGSKTREKLGQKAAPAPKTAPKVAPKAAPKAKQSPVVSGKETVVRFKPLAPTVRRRIKAAESGGDIQGKEVAIAAAATALAGQVPGLNRTANDIAGFLGKNLAPLGLAGIAAGSVWLIAKELAAHRKGKSGPSAKGIRKGLDMIGGKSAKRKASYKYNTRKR